ncbi:MAG: helix-turn-helix transcriptional regulator [Clostridiales bacterium]|nr:helix-turn-helix transcriptional regulator [Clostridiales bacterium]
MKETGDLLSRLNNTKDDKALDNYIGEINGKYKLRFYEYLSVLMRERNLTSTDLISASKIDRSYWYQIEKGDKTPGREKVIMIALGLKASLEETQKMLGLAGQNQLYSKDVRDSLIIYAINKNMTIMDANAMLNKYGVAELK